MRERQPRERDRTPRMCVVPKVVDRETRRARTACGGCPVCPTVVLRAGGSRGGAESAGARAAWRARLAVGAAEVPPSPGPTSMTATATLGYWGGRGRDKPRVGVLGVGLVLAVDEPIHARPRAVHRWPSGAPPAGPRHAPQEDGRRSLSERREISGAGRACAFRRFSCQSLALAGGSVPSCAAAPRARAGSR